MLQDLGSIFKTNDKEQSGMSKTAGSIGIWLLHLAKVTFLIYSGSHAVNAALHYAGSSIPMRLAQIVGIIVTEAVLFGLYLAYVNRQLNGWGQLIAAGGTYLFGFTLACLGIVADSQLNAGGEISAELQAYLGWGLPIAPAFMAFGALIVHLVDPEQLRARKEAEQLRVLDDLNQNAQLAIQQAEHREQAAKKALQLLSREAVLRELGNVFSSAEFQKAIKQTAVRNAPALFAEAGIVMNVQPPAIQPPDSAESTQQEEQGDDFLAETLKRMYGEQEVSE